MSIYELCVIFNLAYMLYLAISGTYDKMYNPWVGNKWRAFYYVSGIAMAFTGQVVTIMLVFSYLCLGAFLCTKKGRKLYRLQKNLQKNLSNGSDLSYAEYAAQ